MPRNKIYFTNIIILIMANASIGVRFAPLVERLYSTGKSGQSQEMTSIIRISFVGRSLIIIYIYIYSIHTSPQKVGT